MFNLFEVWSVLDLDGDHDKQRNPKEHNQDTSQV